MCDRTCEQDVALCPCRVYNWTKFTDTVVFKLYNVLRGLGKNGPGKNGPGKNGPGKNGPEKAVRGIIGLVVESVKTVRSFR